MRKWGKFFQHIMIMMSVSDDDDDVQKTNNHLGVVQDTPVFVLVAFVIST